MAKCYLCPAACGADRETQTGECGETARMRVAKYGLHPYEEPCISAKNGSGTIFFSGCVLRCVFCQNYELSRSETGKEITPKELAAVFAELEEMGAENVNLVTASHFTPQLLQTFALYRPKIPVVYNTHSYETTEALRALDPYIDVWLPDLKYYSPKISLRYTERSDYFEKASRAVRFMSARKAEFDGDKMVRGCIVRHLVLPLCSGDSVRIVDWFAAEKSAAYLSLMGQYTPCAPLENFPELQRKITPREYERVLERAFADGVEKLFVQELSSAEKRFIPDFSENRSLF